MLLVVLEVVLEVVLDIVWVVAATGGVELVETTPSVTGAGLAPAMRSRAEVVSACEDTDVLVDVVDGADAGWMVDTDVLKVVGTPSVILPVTVVIGVPNWLTKTTTS